MKKNEMKKNIILSLLIIFSACSNKLDDNKSIMSTMMQWKQAVLSENPREISKFYSNDFFSEEIGGKEQVAEFWKIVINAGMIDGIEINLNTSKVDLNGDVAEFLIFDDEGEVEMGFILTKENKAWLISGTVSESNENYEDDYLAEYGDERPNTYINHQFEYIHHHIQQGNRLHNFHLIQKEFQKLTKLYFLSLE